MHGQRPDAGLLGNARDAHGIALIGRPAGADLERHRHVDGRDGRVQDGRHEAFVAQQRRTGLLVAYFFCRATHVDVDDLCAGVGVATRRVRHEPRVATRDLHDARYGLVRVVAPSTGFRRIPQVRVRRDHLAGGKRSPQPAAKPSEGQVRHPRHGRQQGVAVEPIRPDDDGWRREPRLAPGGSRRRHWGAWLDDGEAPAASAHRTVPLSSRKQTSSR